VESYDFIYGRLHCLTGSAVGHRLIVPVFKPWLAISDGCFIFHSILFGGRLAHLVYFSGLKTATFTFVPVTLYGQWQLNNAPVASIVDHLLCVFDGYEKCYLLAICEWMSEWERESEWVSELVICSVTVLVTPGTYSQQVTSLVIHSTNLSKPNLFKPWSV